MRERHPYDKSLGEKMNELPVPDINKSWQEMRILLDHEMPPGRSKRRGGWWFPGALLIMLITATSILVTINLSPQHGDPPLTAGGAGGGPAITKTDNLSEKPIEPNDKILHDKQINPPASMQTDGETSAPPADHNAGKQGRKTVANGLNQPVLFSPLTTKARAIKLPGAETEAADRLENDPGSAAGDGNTHPVEVSFPGEGSGDLKELVPSNTSGPVSIKATGLSQRFDSMDLDKPLAAQYVPVSRKFYRQIPKQYRPPNVKEPYTTEGRTFAFGVSLPMGFPLGDQKMLGYNISAGPNTVSDYIPGVHVQYHLNGKSYLQTEVQFMSPQYIRPVMVHHSEYQTTAMQVTSSVFARKLYYFNVPVSVHYSPFKHFYLGTGLQFSSLLGGVAEYETIRTGMVRSDSIYQSTYSRFGKDSIGSRLRGNELRLLLDANYYWNRFTVGLRYNQAFSNYISLRPSTTASYTLDKNKALQFYMRFNLWEEKKRKPIRERVLTYR